MSVTIGRGSWIGEHPVVAADVGRQCVMGAGLLVLEPVTDDSVAVGICVRVIVDRRTLRRWQHLGIASQDSR